MGGGVSWLARNSRSWFPEACSRSRNYIMKLVHSPNLGLAWSFLAKLESAQPEGHPFLRKNLELHHHSITWESDARRAGMYALRGNLSPRLRQHKGSDDTLRVRDLLVRVHSRNSRRVIFGDCSTLPWVLVRVTRVIRDQPPTYLSSPYLLSHDEPQHRKPERLLVIFCTSRVTVRDR